MDRKIVSLTLTSLLILLSIGVSVRFIKSAEDSPTTWTVDDDGPADFHTIQEAINAANDGDTIFVSSGMYYENVVVNKTVLLIGENRETTIVDGSGIGVVVIVKANSSIINGLTVRNSGPVWTIDCGIHLFECSNVTIQNNIVENNSGNGINFKESSGNTISENDITANTLKGIWFYRSSNNSISENYIGNHRWDWGIWLGRSDNNKISRNSIINNGIGVMFDWSYYNTVSENNLSNNQEGILLYSSSDNTFSENNITNNYYFGIKLGTHPPSPAVSNNTFYHNNIMHNTYYQVEPAWCYNNTWDDGYPSGGNYWGDYYNVDEYHGQNQDIPGSDGIGDTPYVIDEQNQDRYPLMEPWKKVSGKLEILEPANGSTIAGLVAITFTIENAGDLIEFLQGDPSNRVDLEIEYRSTNGETSGWGIMLWSTSHYGLTLGSREKHEQTLVYDPPKYEEAVPPDFIGDAPYGHTTIRLVHWKQTDGGYGYGEFGVFEIKVTITFAEDLNFDEIVDVTDIYIVAEAFGSYSSHPEWNPQADIDKNDIVDIRDIYLVAINFGKRV